MPTKNFPRIAVFFVLLLPGPGAAQAVPLDEPFVRRGYSQVGRDNGVTVYKHHGARQVRLGADGRFAAGPGAVLQALLDYPRHTQVVRRLSECRVLRRGKGWLLVYQRLDLPVISDRDFTLLVRWWEHEGVTYVRFQVDNRHGPPRRDGVVRLTHHEGTWQLKAMDGGKATRARFQVSSDMGGMVPGWMATSGAADDLPGLFTAITRLLSRHKV